MTTRQAILDALNGKIKRPELLKVLGIIGEAPNYRYKRKEKEKKVFAPPTITEFVDFFKENNQKSDNAENIYKGYADNNWKDTNGKDIKNWKQKVRFVWFKPENKVQENKGQYKTLNDS